jgi:uncharacterized membrane protein YfcA
MFDLTTVHVIVVIYVATLIRSTFGFGEALIAVPLLALRIPISIAAPLAVLMSVVVAGIIVAQDWRKIQFRSAAWLVVSAVCGIPIGLYLLTHVGNAVAKLALGGVIAGYAIYSLTAKLKWHLENDHRLALLSCGFLSGILGGAYGMNGPPLVVYGALRRWSPQHFRATLQGYFLPVSLLGFIGYAMVGMWTSIVTWYFVCSLPAALLAIAIGRRINHRLRGDGFFRYLYVFLIFVGGLLIVQTLVS